MFKVCSKCKEKKCLSEFYKDKIICKFCKNNYYELYYIEDIKKAKEICEDEALFKEKITELDKKIQEAKSIARRLHRLANITEVRQRENEWRKNKYITDEKFRIRVNLSSRLRKISKQKEVNKKYSILSYIGCSIEHLKNHLASTLDSSWNEVHIDHIIPCCLYDFTNEDEIKKCFNWRNLRYIPGKDNLEKSGKLHLDLVERYQIKDLLPK